MFLSSSHHWGRLQQWNRGGDLRLWERRRSLALALCPRREQHSLLAVPSVGEEASHGLHRGADLQHGEGLQEKRLSGNARQGRAVQEAQSVGQTGKNPDWVFSWLIIFLFIFYILLGNSASWIFVTLPDQKLVPEQEDEAKEDDAGRAGSCLSGERCPSVHALPRATGLQTRALPQIHPCSSSSYTWRPNRFLLHSPVQSSPAQRAHPVSGLILPVQQPPRSCATPGNNATDGLLPNLPTVLLTSLCVYIYHLNLKHDSNGVLCNIWDLMYYNWCTVWIYLSFNLLNVFIPFLSMCHWEIRLKINSLWKHIKSILYINSL